MDAKCHVEPMQKNVRVQEFEGSAIIRLAVWGMGCPNCAARVRNGLLSLRGVLQASVDHVLGAADVRYDPRRTTVEDLIDAVAGAGGDGRHNYRAEVAG